MEDLRNKVNLQWENILNIKIQIENGKTKGTVTLKYWNYKVNKGINDSVFKKK